MKQGRELALLRRSQAHNLEHFNFITPNTYSSTTLWGAINIANKSSSINTIYGEISLDIDHGYKAQYETEPKPIPPMHADGIKRVQEIVGGLMYYTHAVDNNLLAALSEIGLQQAAAAKRTNYAITQLLNYVATYPKNGIIYWTSDMILADHADVAYLNIRKYLSRVGAAIMLTENDPVPNYNGPVLTIAQIIKYDI